MKTFESSVKAIRNVSTHLTEEPVLLLLGSIVLSQRQMSVSVFRYILQSIKPQNDGELAET